jgi:hypothetical protein
MYVQSDMYVQQGLFTSCTICMQYEVKLRLHTYETMCMDTPVQVSVTKTVQKPV